MRITKQLTELTWEFVNAIEEVGDWSADGTKPKHFWSIGFLNAFLRLKKKENKMEHPGDDPRFNYVIENGPKKGLELTKGRVEKKGVRFWHNGHFLWVRVTDDRPILKALVEQNGKDLAEWRRKVEQYKTYCDMAVEIAWKETREKALAETPIPENCIEIGAEWNILSGCWRYTFEDTKLHWSDVKNGPRFEVCLEDGRCIGELRIAWITGEQAREIKEGKQREINLIIQKEENEKNRQIKIMEESKKTGKMIELHSYMAECNDRNEECDQDCVTIWAMPNGTTKMTRQHCW